MLTTSSHHTDDLSLARAGWVWWAVKWTGGLGVGLSAWGWSVIGDRPSSALMVESNSMVALKILLGLSLLSFSALRQAGMDARESEDAVNDFGRSAVGESKGETVCKRHVHLDPSDAEQEYNKQTSQYLSRDRDDLPEYASPNVTPSMSSAAPQTAKPLGGGKKGKKWNLEEVERWTMVKRIW